MLKLEKDVLTVEIPQGKNQEELLNQLNEELTTMEKDLYGIELKITGRLTATMAMFIGHKLCHICKTVSLFAPLENRYVLVIQH